MRHRGTPSERKLLIPGRLNDQIVRRSSWSTRGLRTSRSACAIRKSLTTSASRLRYSSRREYGPRVLFPAPGAPHPDQSGIMREGLLKQENRVFRVILVVESRPHEGRSLPVSLPSVSVRANRLHTFGYCLREQLLSQLLLVNLQLIHGIECFGHRLTFQFNRFPDRPWTSRAVRRGRV
jgi:hypothetical protein